MLDMFETSAYFGFVITIVFFFLASYLKNKFKVLLLNPLLITTILVVAFLLIFHIDYDTYNNGAKYISFFLTPTTVCLAVPLYKQIKILKQNFIGIISGILAGVISNGLVIILLGSLLKLDKIINSSLLAKSITAPIAISLTDELGGISSITVFAVILSGITGAVIAPYIFKLFHIKNATAQGLALGTSAHGSGTTTALELGEEQGAMSGLAIIVTGIITTVIVPIVSKLFL